MQAPTEKSDGLDNMGITAATDVRDEQSGPRRTVTKKTEARGRGEASKAKRETKKDETAGQAKAAGRAGGAPEGCEADACAGSGRARKKQGEAGRAGGEPEICEADACAGSGRARKKQGEAVRAGGGEKRTEAAVNQDVEQALLRKATGYVYLQQESYKLKHVEYDETTGKKKSEWESVEVVEVEKHVPPEYSAIALWLKARMPETWGEAAQAAAVEPVVIVDDIPAQTGRICADGPVDVAQSAMGQDQTKGEKSCTDVA